MKKNHSVPTMKDVAREAGVALGTVSKVVNGLPVGEPYRIRVEDAIKRLNYQVNSYAQGLKANKTYTVAFLLPNTHDPYFASLTYHINLALLRRKYRMLLCCTDYDSSLEQEYITMTQQNKVATRRKATFLQPKSASFSAASCPPAKLSLATHGIRGPMERSMDTNGVFSSMIRSGL